MTEPARHSVSVAGVIVDDSGRVLLTRRRDNGRWEPPGGVLELDETIPDGLRREIREETGLEVEPIALTGVYKNMTLSVVALVFRCRITGGALHPTEEADTFEWTSVDALPASMLAAYRIRISDALSTGTAPAVRTHDGCDVLP